MPTTAMATGWTSAAVVEGPIGCPEVPIAAPPSVTVAEAGAVVGAGGCVVVISWQLGGVPIKVCVEEQVY